MIHVSKTEAKSLRKVAMQNGVKSAAFYARIRRGWTPEDAANTPPHAYFYEIDQRGRKPMNEKQARAKMVADIKSSITRKKRPVNLISLMRIHKALGYDAITIDGESGDFPVGSEFRKDWAEGITLAAMSEIYGVDSSTISKWAAGAGLPARQGGQKHKVRATDAFCQVWNAGIPTKKIADTLGVSTDAVYRAARAAGLPARPMHPTFVGGAAQ